MLLIITPFYSLNRNCQSITSCSFLLFTIHNFYVIFILVKRVFKVNDLLSVIIFFIILSISILICSFLCFLSQYKRVLWETLTNTQKDKKEAKND